ncbi:MAG: hypothetical protein UY16_C0007G0028 [Candidatus Gottesmanbacteria bacterium GW2011_GWA2_47_9]|uniref:GMP synthase n=1 Tax=Candidatus Gottesmanbacteria bacterium GW2011_GWA2_47_9 TaxID=1618445 RepID=A0A0G1U2Z9_9BACT|nr:MAG: hypothetical protein UY16_C0007G0028 [Candidatus Gottesmanbacteria bacterium GW2011_GWA2_47_9]
MDLKEHLATEHKISPITTYLREIVYGGNDGIVTTFAVVAGFTGAQTNAGMTSIPFISVLLFGLANLMADGTSMSLGSFLSIRAEKDVYRAQKAKELHEIKHSSDMELEETIEILKQKGYSSPDAQALAKLLSKNERYWTEFMMHDELELPNPERENALYIAIATFVSFVLFGFIPLIPYIIAPGTSGVFYLSVAFTLLALLLLGILRWKVSHRSLPRSVAETMLIGIVSASVAYVVGIFFR